MHGLDRRPLVDNYRETRYDRVMTDTAPLPAKPATPYAGTAQHSAVRAAIKRTHPHIPTTESSNVPWVSVDGRGSVPRTPGAYVATPAAAVVVHPPRYGRNYDAEALDALRDSIIEALRAAGWTVVTRDSVTYSVYGPGAERWVSDARKEGALAALRRQAAEDKAREERTRALTVRDALDVGRVEFNHGRHYVTLTVEEAEGLLAARLRLDRLDLRAEADRDQS